MQLIQTSLLCLCAITSIIFLRAEQRALFQYYGKIYQQVSAVAKNNKIGGYSRPEDDPLVQSNRYASTRLPAHQAANSTTGEKVSGCLLIKDENHQLSEWLAYHYLRLPLRHLVVAIDPNSITSPAEIFKRWTKDTGDGFEPMDIVLWNDGDFFEGTTREGKMIYIDRQRDFVRKCAQYHKQMNRTWVIMTDPDEFITVNKFEYYEPGFSQNQVNIPCENKPLICQKFVDDGIAYNSSSLLREHRPFLWYTRERKIKARKSLPSSEVEAGVEIVPLLKKAPWVDDACILIPRILFTSLESPPEVVSQSKAETHGFDPMKFRTLRYFQHDGKIPHWWGKVIMDVSRIPQTDLDIMPESVHSPFPQCGWPIPRYEESVLKIHHYLGSWEEYAYKQDCRRNRAKFDQRSSTAKSHNYDLQLWLGSFIDLVGIYKARYLLQGAGDIPILLTTDGVNCTGWD